MNKTPKIKIVWTKELCRQEALKYNKRTDFAINSKSIYMIARGKGWLNEICLHMPKKTYSSIYTSKMTKELCHQEAIKFKTRTQFSIYSSTAYNVARVNGWLDDICSHMKIVWTKELCRQEALKYVYKVDFSTKSASAYNAARVNGWLIEIGSHLIKKTPHLNKIWPKERCRKEAAKYTLLKEFRKACHAAFHTAWKNGWLREITSHMDGFHKRMGEWTFERCQNEASKYTRVTDFYNCSRDAYNVSKTKGIFEEICAHMLPTQISKEDCLLEALKYTNRRDFQIMSRNIYVKTRIKGWLGEACAHMKRLKSGCDLYWTKERCRQEALKYTSRSQFCLYSQSAYGSSLRNNWHDDVCSHMPPARRK